MFGHGIAKERRHPKVRRRSLLGSSNDAWSCEPLEPRTLLAAFRPPAVPLITSDPYLSVWSQADHLNDTSTTHWTGAENALVSLIRVDGVSSRLMGNNPGNLAAFPQSGMQVLPTRTIYDFDNGHVHVTMTFMQPALASDLNALSLPLSYITWDVRSVDGQNHAVQIYDSVSSELAVNGNDHLVTWQRGAINPGSANALTTLRVGTTTQNYFNPAGDGVRIDWGYAYLAANTSQVTSSIGGDAAEINAFVTNGALSNTDDANTPRAVNNNQPVMAMAFNLGTVGSGHVLRNVIVAYDEVKSINYFGQSLAPYWARNGTTTAQMLTTAASNYASYVTQTAAFDSTLMADMTAAGGSDYAQLGALAYRQTFAGTGLAVDPNGQLLAFPKENSSNGDISTVDVLYPMFPQLLLFSPTLAKASLQPVMDYANSSEWNFPNAPHDLGTYPVVLGRPDGGEAMPVEETANMLIMLDAIAKIENSAEYAAQFWPLISQWADFLKPYADTPGQQLTTDDFLGVITNSTNLAVKAIVGLGAYADLAKRMGDPTLAASYTTLAQADVTHWINQSLSSDGTHWLMSYGQQGTSAQQYNLVWDQILDTNLFPASVAAKDIAYSKSIVTTYGVPIRSTTNMVGVDWSVWAATLATNNADFQTLINPIYNFMNVTGNRQPFTDKYDHTNINSGIFRARTVVGGVFAKMLDDPALWSKYASQDHAVLGVYAAFPVKSVVVPSANQTPQTWRYTTVIPPASWMNTGFADSSWSSGLSAFGTAGTPGLVRNTNWSTPDIYLRRSFKMPAGTFSNLQLEAYYDEDIQVYINGVLAASTTGYVTGYVTLEISAAAKAQLVAGNTITLAVHCHQTTGGQGVDVGLVNLQPGVRPGFINGTINGGKPGQTVYLDANGNGTLDTGEISTVTTSINVYNFSDVPTGAYTIRQVIPAGYAQSSPSGNGGIAINVTAGAALMNQNFVDVTPPAVPAAPDLVAAADTGSSSTDNITSTHDLEVTGYVEPNAKVSIYANGAPVGLRVADATGFYDIPFTMGYDGTYAITARSTNAAGTSAASAATNVTIDSVAPTVSSASYDRELTQDLSVNVSDGLAAQLAWQNVMVTNLTTALAVPAIASLMANADGSVAKLHFASRVPNGRFRVLFPLGAVVDVAGNRSAQYTFDFSQLAGDANGDGVVNFADLVTVALHYNTTGYTFSGGNFDYSVDGKVDFADLVLLAHNYNTSLPAASVVAASSGESAAGKGIALAGLVEPKTEAAPPVAKKRDAK